MKQVAVRTVIIAIALFIISEFIQPIIWGGLLAVCLWRVNIWLTSKVGRIKSASILVFFASMAFIVPIAYLLWRAEIDLAPVIYNISQGYAPQPPAWLTSIPMIGAPINSWWSGFLDPSTLQHGLSEVANTASHSAIFKSAPSRLATVFFSIFTMLFCLISGEKIYAHLVDASQLIFGNDSDSVIQNVRSSINTTVSSILIIGIGEGLVVGVIYILCGLPYAAIFTVGACVAGMIPYALFIAVGIMFFACMSYNIWLAILILTVSIVLIFIGDHIVRPIMLRGETKTPFILSLFSILGGFETLGFIGLFVGPILVNLAILMWSKTREDAENRKSIL